MPSVAVKRTENETWDLSLTPYQKRANKKGAKLIHKNCGFHPTHLVFTSEISIQPTQILLPNEEIQSLILDV